jgi:acetylornithine deacetylase/succinyl-diaminopimelate desuccinylase-like protein
MQISIAQRVIELACTIQQIPAPTYGEAQRSEFVQQCFNAEGLAQVSRDAIGNVYVCIPGKSAAAPLIITAHLDTVFPADTDLSLRRTPERIFGPGLGDNSLGVAALMGLVWSNPELPRDVWLVANVCEEGLGNLHGIKAVVDRFGRDVLAYIVLEGMSLGQVYHSGLGVQRYRISVNTSGGHAWVNYGRPSAIHELAELVVQINGLPVPSQPRTSLNVGIIRGGTTINTIAPEASLDLDLRSESAASLSSLAMQVEALVKSAEKDAPYPVKTRIEAIGHRPAGQIPTDHPLVRLAVQVLQEQGIAARLNTGSTDANCPLSYGLPAICVGVTTGGGAHTTDEFINLPPVETGLKQLTRLVELAGSQLA